MVTREEVFDRIKSTMNELFDVDPGTVTLDTKLIDDLGLDSIDAIDLAARLEEVTQKRLTEESLRKLRTVRDVVDLIFGMLDEPREGE
jgi:acyl carrier protein